MATDDSNFVFSLLKKHSRILKLQKPCSISCHCRCEHRHLHFSFTPKSVTMAVSICSMQYTHVHKLVSPVVGRIRISSGDFAGKRFAAGARSRVSVLSVSGRISGAVAIRRSSALRGRFLGEFVVADVQRRAFRLRGLGVRAGIKKEVERAVSEFEVGLQEGRPEDDLSQLAVSLPLGLASFEGLFLVGWVASLRGLLPGSRGFFGAADLILCGVMVANCVVGWYALEHSRSEVDGLPKEKRARKVKAAGPGLVDMGFSLAVSFIPFANLFLWLKFATKQRHLSAKAKAALVANALVYEGPRLFALLLLFSGGLWVFLQVGLVSNVALFLSALHRPFEEARIKNEKVLMEVSSAKTIGGKKGPKPPEISPEEKERIARLRELEEFDQLLAQRSPPGSVLLPGNAKEWTVGETMEWLGQQGLARYATAFAENHIDGALLVQLTNDDLRDELKILSFGDRRKLELLIRELRDR
ncbi:hypothetical protein M758_2G024500 [Ceratodon purpureus]|uniref:SAM domain-containing protein n=1 Tax=Ceratodon purpureus TaxID=3225 RepID=A0A8T0IPC5_CERPU|nr:hypothetical protein KC19_2G025100 [Ceratodon purpureus]KAG0625058.1 hypothetical protein M758_2G024500 [Ceratodon purpureus]